jgi:hypothetical protein
VGGIQLQNLLSGLQEHELLLPVRVSELGVSLVDRLKRLDSGYGESVGTCMQRLQQGEKRLATARDMQTSPNTKQ